NNFNNIDKISEFELAGDKQEVYITSGKGKCLVATDSILTAKTDKCDKTDVLTITNCKNKFYTISNASGKCLTETRFGFKLDKCDCKSVSQNIKIRKNLNRSFFLQPRSQSGIAFTVNFASIVTKFRLIGGINQQFHINYSVPPKSAFESEDKGEGKIGVIQYKLEYTLAADYVFRTLVENRECKCANCNLEVLPAAPSFEHFQILRYGSSNSWTGFPEVIKEDNTKTQPLYRIVARDRFNNFCPKFDKSQYSFTVYDNSKQKNGYKLLVNEKVKEENILEVGVNDSKAANNNKWENLVSGGYELVIASKDGKKRTRKITMIGTDDDEDAGNSKLAIQKTEVKEADLDVIAMETGTIILILRTITGRRRNEWGHKIECFSSHKDNFSCKSRKGGKKGVYIIHYSTDMANNFPSPGVENLITFKVNDVLVTAIKLKLNVSPAEMHSCEIIEEDRQDTAVIRTGNADTPLSFDIQCKDEYLNICKAEADKLNVSIKNPKNVELKFKPTLQRLNGQLTIDAPTKKAGLYTISGDNNYFKNIYKYDNQPGVLVAANTVHYTVEKELVAGNTAQLFIEGRDQYENTINADGIDERFAVSVTTPGKKVLKAVADVKADHMLFNVLLTEKGKTKFYINIDNKTKDCGECTCDVNPGTPNLENTLFHTTNLGTDNKQGEVTKTNKYLTKVIVCPRDDYNNQVDELDDKLALPKLELSGHNANLMKFTFEKTKEGNCWNITMNDYLSIRQYSRLVKSKGYEFECGMKYGEQAKTFKYKVNILSSRNDEGRGNGNFVAKNTEFSEPKLAIVAGDTASFDITLKTSEKKIFNDGINVAQTISYKLKHNDDKFTFKCYKRGYASGIYTCEVSTTKTFESEQEITILIKEIGAKDFT
ncbi:MAG: hypothetical protein GY861_22885, partial [bacterium]|nr:hypothetical protein [bacterium]